MILSDGVEKIAMIAGSAIMASIIIGMRSVVMMKLFLPTRSMNSRLTIIPRLLFMILDCMDENVVHRGEGAVEAYQSDGVISQ